MEVLLVVRDPLVRDQIKVGLQQFSEFTVTCGEGYAAINQVRQRHYDCVFLEMDPGSSDGMRLLQHLRSFDKTTDVAIVTTERHARDMAGEKSRMNIHAFLHLPIDVKQFFRLLGRLRERKAASEGRRGRPVEAMRGLKES